MRKEIFWPLIMDMEGYYGNFVNGLAPTLNASREMALMLLEIEKEESRIRYYIGSEENIHAHTQALNKHLIISQLPKCFNKGEYL